ncbi:MAG: hypothetical protein EXQ70_02285 [Solirubrobacterales bacterium]|nr:hypothetical protein [Solirubrobacterales bacterium]
MPIEDWISDPIASERHERPIPSPPERALEIAMSTPLRADGLSSTLMGLRGLSADGTIGEFFTGEGGFLLLHRDGREFVAGVATKVWKLGLGGAAAKRSKYAELAPSPEGNFYRGFKLFFVEDNRLMSPGQVLKMKPRPVDLVVYE